MTCLACKSHQVETWPEYDLVSCLGCGYKESIVMDYVNPYLTTKSLTDKFVELDGTEGARRLNEIRIGQLRTYVPLGDRVIDLGCSVGMFLHAARIEGYFTLGVECSPWAVETARHRGLEIYQGELETLPDMFLRSDAVTMFDVIEHLRNPRDVFGAIADILSTCGILQVSTPDCEGIARAEFGQWRHYRPNEHYHYFTLKALSSMMEEFGFKVVHFSHDESIVRVDPKRPLKNILTVIAKKES